MADSANATDKARAILKQAEDLIVPALKSGACSDPRLLEALAGQLPSLGVDNEKQLKLMLDAAFFFYVSGRPDRGLDIAAKARSFALEAADAKATAAALTMLGICAADTGNLPMAMEAYADALSLAKNLHFFSRGIGHLHTPPSPWANCPYLLNKFPAS